MRLLRTPGSRRIAAWAERSLWALGLLLIGYWGYSQASIRFEQARLEKSLFGEASAAANDELTAELASAASSSAPALAPGTPVALIEIPRVELRAMVVEGVDSKSLERAAGHLPGTALPGAPGNSVMAAHRDTLFAGLRHVRLGDLVTLRTGERELSYQVSAIDVVTPRSLHVLDPTPHPSLTLITCFHFDFVGPAPMRFVVSAIYLGAAAPDGQPPLAGDERALEAERSVGTSARGPRAGRGNRGERPLDPRVLSFLSGSLVKPGAN
jgi:sortase A